MTMQGNKDGFCSRLLENEKNKTVLENCYKFANSYYYIDTDEIPRFFF